jgi:hypothetical protein
MGSRATIFKMSRSKVPCTRSVGLLMILPQLLTTVVCIGETDLSRATKVSRRRRVENPAGGRLRFRRNNRSGIPHFLIKYGETNRRIGQANSLFTLNPPVKGLSYLVPGPVVPLVPHERIFKRLKMAYTPIGLAASMRASCLSRSRNGDRGNFADEPRRSGDRSVIRHIGQQFKPQPLGFWVRGFKCYLPGLRCQAIPTESPHQTHKTLDYSGTPRRCGHSLKTKCDLRAFS